MRSTLKKCSLREVQAWIPFKRNPGPGVGVYFWAAYQKGFEGPWSRPQLKSGLESLLVRIPRDSFRIPMDSYGFLRDSLGISQGI